MPRETIKQKAERYLLASRLVITSVAGDLVLAEARGDGAIYCLGHDDRGWHCSCEARHDCSHLVALRMVTVQRHGG